MSTPTMSTILEQPALQPSLTIVQEPLARDAKERRNNKRLTPEGYAVLNALFHENPKPTQAQLEELHARLQTIPRCEWYTVDLIKRWFYRKRKSAATKGRAGPTTASVASSRAILYPSLSDAAIEKLRVLIRECEAPTNVEIGVWARRLKADADDVRTWVDLHNTCSVDGSASAAGTSTTVEPKWPPTPAPSMSPEPVLRMIPSNAPATELTPPVPGGPREVIEAATAGMLHESSGSITTLQSALETFSVQLCQSLSQQPPITPIKDIKEFSDWAERPYTISSRFLEAGKEGQYSHLGLHPSLLRAALQEEDLPAGQVKSEITL